MLTDRNLVSIYSSPRSENCDHLCFKSFFLHRNQAVQSCKLQTSSCDMMRKDVQKQHTIGTGIFFLAAAWVCPGRIALQSAKQRWEETLWPSSQIDVIHQAKVNKNMQSRPKNHPQKGPKPLEKRMEGTSENPRVSTWARGWHRQETYKKRALVKSQKKAPMPENEVRGRSGVDGCVLFTIVRQQTKIVMVSGN